VPAGVQRRRGRSGPPHPNAAGAGAIGLGPRQPRYATTVSVEVEGAVQDPTTAHFGFGLVPQGFCWAFPRHGGFSIGLGHFIGRPLEEAAALEEADAVLNRLLPSLGFAAGDGKRCQGRLRVWDGHHPLHGDGIVVAGDAASLCDPFLAEGLRPALLSGCSAADTMHRWLNGDGNALAGYSAAMRQQWGDSMAWGRRIAQVWHQATHGSPADRPDSLRRDGLWRHRPAGHPPAAVPARLEPRPVVQILVQSLS